jgi:hypothetical protein
MGKKVDIGCLHMGQASLRVRNLVRYSMMHSVQQPSVSYQTNRVSFPPPEPRTAAEDVPAAGLHHVLLHVQTDCARPFHCSGVVRCLEDRLNSTSQATDTKGEGQPQQSSAPHSHQCTAPALHLRSVPA